MINNTFTFKEQRALLALTKSICIDNCREQQSIGCAELLDNGLIFIDESGNPVTSVPFSIAREAIVMYGYSNEDFNNTLIDSFATVADMEPEEFYTIQILHYLTTYGTNFTTPFIVGARQYTPEETAALRITIIRAVSATRALDTINDLFAKTAAPKEQNLEYYRVLAPLTTIAPEDIKSKELMIIVCAELGIRPLEPVALLRYLVYTTTNETLLIKNKKLIESIKINHASATALQSLTEDEMKALASIFYRYKPLFLAFKTPKTARVINRIRRLATKYHKPDSALTLKNFTMFAARNSHNEVNTLIARASNRELIKLYNATVNKFNYGRRLFQIRNGRIWYDSEIGGSRLNALEYMNLLDASVKIRNELQERLSGYKGMTIYMPRGISYAVPYSEKQFSGAIPWGTTISANSDDNAFTAGIHWVNDPDERHCDLDLHTHTPTQHLGWNGFYISDNSEIIYSGDMTDAPAETGGAAESFYINNVKDPVILTVNAFSAKPNKQFQFFITEGKDDELKERCTFDSSKLVSAPLPLAFAGRQALTLGLFVNKKFYVYGGNLNQDCVPTNDYPKVIEALLNRLPDMYSLRALAKDLGINIVNEMPLGIPFLDLSPDALTVDTLLDFVDGKAADLLHEPIVF